MFSAEKSRQDWPLTIPDIYLSYMHSVQSLFAVRQMIYTAKGHTSVLNDLKNPNILVYIIQRCFLEYIFYNSEKCA